MEESIYLENELRLGMIRWYPFSFPCKILFVGRNELDKSVQENFCDLGVECSYFDVKTFEEEMSESDDPVYNYAVILDGIEYSKKPIQLLKKIKNCLRTDGVLLIGADNRLGIKYFCGDRDPFTKRNFDGIENYLRIDPADHEKMEGRLYSKAELSDMLGHAGFCNNRFYSVFPEVSRPQILIAEDYAPNEELNIRIFPQYNYPDTVFLEEEGLYSTLLKNNMFHAMANGFLIECSTNQDYANAFQITVSADRGKENGMSTIIKRDGYVEKKPLYSEGNRKLRDLKENNEYLKSHGITMIDAKIENNSLVMPYVEGIPLVSYFRELLETNKEEFMKQLDYLWELILHSSEHVPYEDIAWEYFEPGWEHRKADDPNKDKWRKVAYGTKQEQDNLGVILKRGYLDLVVLNGFFKDSNLMFFDQEMYVENLPAKAILLRNIDFIYQYNKKFELIVPRRELLSRYQLVEYQNLFYKYIWSFLGKLRNDEKLAKYNREHRRNADKINANRQRMNFSEEEYNRMFRDIFCHAQGKKLYLFGSGNFANMFLSQFRKDYDVTGIIDNLELKWGTYVEGIPVMSPEILTTLDPSECKVIVCIKNYVPVIKQLEDMGIKNFSIYDIGMEYPRKLQMPTNDISGQMKQFNLGYIAGVFDLFHIGHLNLLRRAKEQCNYLIVGVVTDEGVRKHKRSNPEIPFEDRIEIVRACKYVDEAVEIPLDQGGTDEAYRRYQFDVQFSGSDYVNDPGWQANKEFLEKHGAKLVFFPYTEKISSTSLKEVIRKK